MINPTKSPSTERPKPPLLRNTRTNQLPFLYFRPNDLHSVTSATLLLISLPYSILSFYTLYYSSLLPLLSHYFHSGDQPASVFLRRTAPSNFLPPLTSWFCLNFETCEAFYLPRVPFPPFATRYFYSSQPISPWGRRIGPVPTLIAGFLYYDTPRLPLLLRSPLWSGSLKKSH